MISAASVRWDFLADLASQFSRQAQGSATVVYPAETGVYYWGKAGRRSDGVHEIALRLDMTPSQFVSVFWHELGHVVHGHAAHSVAHEGIKPAIVPYIRDESLRERLQTRIDKIESEADAFADTAAAVFVRVAGASLEQFCFVG